MPDLMIQAFWHCRSAEDWETTVPSKSGDEPHIVRWDSTSHRHHHDCQHDWSCDCTGYMVRGTCSHIERVKREKRRCGWMQFTDGGHPTYDTAGRPTCPKCGSPVEAANWAV